MEVDLNDIIHERIINRCEKLFNDGHYPEACHRAFEIVASTIKEKTGSQKFGRNLKTLMETGKEGIKLRIPFGEQMQKAAVDYFDAAFAYYRNYSAHEGENIDKSACMRGIIVASELLDLIGASKISFDEIGGFPGLLKYGVFTSKEDVIHLLHFLQGEQILDDICDGFYEALAYRGFSEKQLQALFDVGLIEYEISLMPGDPSSNPAGYTDVDIFRVTALGQSVMNGKKG